MKNLLVLLALFGAVTCTAPAWAEEKAADTPVATATMATPTSAAAAEASAAPAFKMCIRDRRIGGQDMHFARQ